MNKTLSSILSEFDKAKIRHLSLDEGMELDGILWISKLDAKSFIRSQFTELLESLKMGGNFRANNTDAYKKGKTDGYIQAIQEINNKIKEIIGK